MSGDITIRGAKNAKKGLAEMIRFIRSQTEVDTMIELGCYVGDSTEIFAQKMDKVFAVDPWVNGYDDKDAASHQHPMNVVEKQFDRMASRYPNITKMKMTSEEALAYFSAKKPVDMVYIDALHTYEGCKADIKRYRPVVREGGWLCGHDYQGRFPGVIKAVDEFQKPDEVFADTSWVIRV
jgi:cephalosporin hydroxylase